jgi:hypothetical protein
MNARVKRRVELATIYTLVGGLAAMIVIPMYLHEHIRLDSQSALDTLHRNTQQILTASTLFAQACASTGKPMPAAVTLRELVSSGYLNGEEMRALKDGNAVVTIIASVPSIAGTKGGSNILARTTLANGRTGVLFLNGMVESYSAK